MSPTEVWIALLCVASISCVVSAPPFPQAQHFKQTSQKVARTYWWKNVKMVVVIVVIVLVIVLIIILLATGVIPISTPVPPIVNPTTKP